MALVSKNIPNFINGVSQQPPALRLAGQGEIQENGLSDVVAGLKKRPPTAHVNDLKMKDTSNNNADMFVPSEALALAYIHTYQRSVTEQFTVILIPQAASISIVASAPLLLVYDKGGNLRYQSNVGSFVNGSLTAQPTAPVSVSGDKADTMTEQQGYLNAYFPNGTTKEDLATTSVSDYTFMVNKNKVVAKLNVTNNSRPFEGLFYLKIANYARRYKLLVKNADLSATLFSGEALTKDGSGSDDAKSLRTGIIMDHITDRSDQAAFFTSSTQMSMTSGFSKSGTSRQPFVVLSHNTTDFNVVAEDDDGGVNFRGFKESVSKFTDLPKNCSDGFIIQVEGDSQKKEDDFYVQYEGSDAAGVWKECAAPSRPNNSVSHYLDRTTMPHTLSQNSNGTFTFAKAEWDERKCGDDNTNPFPSFVGNTINDVFFHRNRLGFLSDENVIFSEASSYFNFFRVTVRSLLDSAPIDVAVSQNEVSILKHAVPFQEQLIMFSDLNQFSLSSDTLLTPSEVAIDTSTSFDCDLSAKPAPAGKTVYFATSSGSFSGVREYVTNVDLEVNDAPLITAHIPTYIEGSVIDMVSSTNEDTLIVRTDNNLKEIYIYKWYEPDKERLQSSWSKWIFDQDVVHVCFNGSKLYIVFKNGAFEYLDFDRGLDTTITSEENLVHYVNLNQLSSTYSSNRKGWIQAETHTGTQPVLSNRQTTDVPTTFDPTNGNVYENYVQDLGDGTYKHRMKFHASYFGHTDYNNLNTQVVSAANLAYTDLPNRLIVGSDSIIVEQVVVGVSAAPISTPKKIYATIDNTAETVVFERFITQTEYNSLFADNTTTAVYFNNNVQITGRTLSQADILLDHGTNLYHNGVFISPTLANYNTNLAAFDNLFLGSGSYTTIARSADTVYVDHNGNIIATGENPDNALFVYLHGTHSVTDANGNGQNNQNYIFIGKQYNFKYQLSEQVYSPEQNDVQQIARFQLKQIHFHFTNTGDFDVTVESTGRDTKVTKLGNSTLAQATNIVGYQPFIKSGTLPVGIQSQSKETKITLTNNTHKPSIFQSAEWEGMIEFRGKRI